MGAQAFLSCPHGSKFDRFRLSFCRFFSELPTRQQMLVFMARSCPAFSELPTRQQMEILTPPSAPKLSELPTRQQILRMF